MDRPASHPTFGAWRQWEVKWLLSCLLGIVGLLLAAQGSVADSLVLDAGALVGAQVDAAIVSPAPMVRAAEPQAENRTHVVQPGETLSTIADVERIAAADLARWNSIADPNDLQAGQTLVINPLIASGSAAIGTLPVDSGISHLRISPWPPEQGDTVRVWFTARQPVSVTLSFAGTAYPVAQEGRRGWALLPVAALAPADNVSLTLSAGKSPVVVQSTILEGTFLNQEIPATTSDSILGQQERVAAEAERIRQILAGTPDRADWSPGSRFQAPLEGEAPQTSPFGTRRTYGTGTSISAHEGEDFSAGLGTPVLAPASGEVVLAESLFVRGNAVVLSHGDGVFTGYWHLSAISVSSGDLVEAGQELGEVGSTGLSTGAHLHWEMRVHGVAVDPMRWLAPQ